MAIRCEGYRRRGGAFTFGPVVWKQCGNDAEVELIIVQDKKKSAVPSCVFCWNEAISNDKVQVKSAKPYGGVNTLWQ
jgi:hypothetical protein